MLPVYFCHLDFFCFFFFVCCWKGKEEERKNWLSPVGANVNRQMNRKLPKKWPISIATLHRLIREADGQLRARIDDLTHELCWKYDWLHFGGIIYRAATCHHADSTRSSRVKRRICHQIHQTVHQIDTGQWLQMDFWRVLTAFFSFLFLFFFFSSSSCFPSLFFLNSIIGGFFFSEVWKKRASGIHHMIGSIWVLYRTIDGAAGRPPSVGSRFQTSKVQRSNNSGIVDQLLSSTCWGLN